MILLTFVKVSADNQNEDIASKTPAAKGGYIKVANPFSR